MIDSWRDVWEGRGEGVERLVGGEDDILETLLRLDGYDSATGSLGLADFRDLMEYLSGAVGLRADDTLYEVGCGAGAVLRSLRPRCAAVGGLDYSASLVRVARMAVGSQDLAVSEACDLEVEPRYDVVASVGAFLYFPDAAYCRATLLRMVAKARRAVAVIDVNDAARRALALELRARADPAGARRQQLFLDRGFFEEFAREHGLGLRIDECTVEGSINSRYRYNAFMQPRAGNG